MSEAIHVELEPMPEGLVPEQPMWIQILCLLGAFVGGPAVGWVIGQGIGLKLQHITEPLRGARGYLEAKIVLPPSLYTEHQYLFLLIRSGGYLWCPRIKRARLSVLYYHGRVIGCSYTGNH